MIEAQGACAVCPYCHTNKDGYTQNLPREGNGKAYIWHHHPIHGGWQLEVTQKRFAHMTVKIIFCPICGRRLED
jgi:hypothetical protein|nr:MAG TPA: zinc-ribbon containing domain protein [Caudoviricetes sp.]DAL52068.1 MAG TPA_asm: zinc-ribbon containing domain protein [Caudoviricetes sp.]